MLRERAAERAPIAIRALAIQAAFFAACNSAQWVMPDGEPSDALAMDVAGELTTDAALAESIDTRGDAASEGMVIDAPGDVPCGESGQSCCSGSCGASLLCASGTCVPCGDSTQPCCDTGATCSSSALACASGTCVPCGAARQPCCAGTCGVGLGCNPASTCVTCGHDMQPCCAGGMCAAGFICQGGTCRYCGAYDEPCCAGDTCTNCPSTDYCFCLMGVCTISPCRVDGAECCSGHVCQGRLVCDSTGVCRTCGGPGQPCCSDTVPCTTGMCVSGTCM